MTNYTFFHAHRNTKYLSFVAVDRLIEAAGGRSECSSKVSIRRRKLEGTHVVNNRKRREIREYRHISTPNLLSTRNLFRRQHTTIQCL